ncbi:polyprenyl synthetase family protein [Candidatus Bathyarchaeota archaeon]|nr:polyprenyl synthetase family protein [Candidatus Bathyarchaeota archaeon]MBS7628564.1 polyprenyl synthetase family protein [Candidatus Bathyarchaeota archaeon]
MVEWDKILDEYSRIIEARVSRFLDGSLMEASAYHPYISDLYNNLSEYVLRRGKRLASCSTLLTYKGYRGEVDEKILDVCVGVELYRHSILIHDDLADDDETRRGAETIHRKYCQWYGFRFGVGVGVFAGNILYSLALRAIGSSDFNIQEKIQTIQRLNMAFQEVNESQILDLLFEHKMPDVAEWYIMASKRAASLFKASILVGAQLAGASPRDLELLEEAAEQIGYCFDIQDDIIDTFASEQEYGRRPGGDLTRNKKPLHIVYTYMTATQPQIEFIRRVAQSTLTDEDLEKAREIVRGCGALNEAAKRSIRHADSAKDLISDTGMNIEVKEFFSSFIDYIKESLSWYK